MRWIGAVAVIVGAKCYSRDDRDIRRIIGENLQVRGIDERLDISGLARHRRLICVERAIDIASRQSQRASLLLRIIGQLRIEDELAAAQADAFGLIIRRKGAGDGLCGRAGWWCARLHRIEYAAAEHRDQYQHDSDEEQRILRYALARPNQPPLSIAQRPQPCWAVGIQLFIDMSEPLARRERRQCLMERPGV